MFRYLRLILGLKQQESVAFFFSLISCSSYKRMMNNIGRQNLIITLLTWKK